MKVYTVHEPSDARSPSPGDRPEALAFVKEGFCWPALFFPLIWLIWHRMWWVLLGWLAVGVALAAAGELDRAAEPVVAVVSILFTVWFALEANSLRRWTLSRHGWRMVGVAAGRDLDEAERSFFTRRLAGQAAPPARSRVPSVGSTVGNRPSAGGQPVIGLFPEPK